MKADAHFCFSNAEMPITTEYRNKYFKLKIFTLFFEKSTIQQHKVFQIKILVTIFRNDWHLCITKAKMGNCFHRSEQSGISGNDGYSYTSIRKKQTKKYHFKQPIFRKTFTMFQTIFRI